jgi:hypothetical protein
MLFFFQYFFTLLVFFFNGLIHILTDAVIIALVSTAFVWLLLYFQKDSQFIAGAASKFLQDMEKEKLVKSLQEICHIPTAGFSDNN